MTMFHNGNIKIGNSKSTLDDIVASVIAKRPSADNQVKTAASEKEEGDESGQLKVEPLHQEGESEKPSDVTKDNKKEASSEKEECDPSGQLEVEPLHQEGESEEASKVDGKNKKTEASDSLTFVKIAKLTSDERSMLEEFWGNLFPKEYVDYMLQEK